MPDGKLIVNLAQRFIRFSTGSKNIWSTSCGVLPKYHIPERCNSINI